MDAISLSLCKYRTRSSVADEHSWVWQAFLEGFLKNFATQNREAFGMVANMLPSLEQRFLIDLLKRLASS